MTKAIKLFKGALVFLFLFIFSFSFKGSVGITYAATTTYSNVLDDLQTDTEFDASIYPAVDDDYSLQVIQIAESTNGELFLYVYQPSAQAKVLTATSVNMSLSETVDGTQLYDLKLLSNTSVFQKYLVKGVTVSSDETRYYNISSIFRPWIDGIDEETGNNNTINEKNYEVGKCYKVTKENGELKYYCKHTEIIKIINPYADYLEYSNGFFLRDGYWCDSHYVAFSTDKQIDYLFEATVEYVKTPVVKSEGKITYKTPVEDKAEVTGEQKGENEANGWFAKKYEWKRIQTVEEFKASEDLTDETLTNLEGKKWILRFLETDRMETIGITTPTYLWTEVSNVTILRLKFISAGRVYNLGAVSDKVTGDDVPGNNNTNEYASLWEWLERLTGVPDWVWKIIIIGLPILIVLGVLSAIFPIVWTVVKFVLKGLWLIVKYVSIGIWYVISSPFRLIAWLVNRGKDGDDGEQ